MNWRYARGQPERGFLSSQEKNSMTAATDKGDNRRGEVEMVDNDSIREVEMKGLTLGVDLPAQKVYEEICPECPFKTGFCEWRMKLTLAHPELHFVCPGMRAWVSKGN